MKGQSNAKLNWIKSIVNLENIFELQKNIGVLCGLFSYLFLILFFSIKQSMLLHITPTSIIWEKDLCM